MEGQKTVRQDGGTEKNPSLNDFITKPFSTKTKAESPKTSKISCLLE